MNTDDWIEGCRTEAQARGDRHLLRLCTLHNEAWYYRESDPSRALALYEEGSRLAQALNQPWWHLYYEDWCVNALLFFLYDYQRGLERAVRTALEARKPSYEGFPERNNVQFNLVDAYIGIDPEGYAPLIKEALRYLEEESVLEGQDRYRLLKSQCEIGIILDNPEEGERFAQRVLGFADQDDNWSHALFHSTFAYSRLSWLAWTRADAFLLTDYARAGLQAAQEYPCNEGVAEFLMWLAVAARLAGEETEAQGFQRRAMSLLGRIHIAPDWVHFQAHVAFHESAANWTRALEIRACEARHLESTGRLLDQVRCHLEICRLRDRLGQPWQVQADRTRQAIQRLRYPDRHLARLEQLLRGAPDEKRGSP